MTRVAVILALLALSGCSAQPAGPIAPVVDAGIEGGHVLASGTVGGVAEDGGLCQFTFWAENGEASRLTSTGVADGDRTACPEVGEALTMLSPGSYELVLTYRSGDIVEKSAPLTVVVPER